MGGSICGWQVASRGRCFRLFFTGAALLVVYATIEAAFHHPEDKPSAT